MINSLGQFDRRIAVPFFGFLDRLSAMDERAPLPADVAIVMASLHEWLADPGDQWGEGVIDSKAFVPSSSDYPVVSGVFLAVGIAVLLINLLVDLSYGFLDPKVRHR